MQMQQVRADAAAAEFLQNGIGDIVHVEHRDIEGLGFPQQHHGTAQVRLFWPLVQGVSVQPLYSWIPLHQHLTSGV